jgi:lysophospholipase L1-like esterase
MKTLLAIFVLFVTNNFCNKNIVDPMIMTKDTIEKKIYYLALGDSYTIGQSVAAPENYPNQVVTLLQKDTFDFQPARIIARTGWTTDELEAGIIASNSIDPLRSSYDFVSLLIGVNNQYRGISADNYKPEFEELLKKAIHFAGDRADHVIIISIPDWGVTPFASGRDRVQISMEIDAYNAANKQIALQYHVEYLDITPWTREAATDLSLLVNDGLHPSGKEYGRWAEKIAAFFKSKI